MSKTEQIKVLVSILTFNCETKATQLIKSLKRFNKKLKENPPKNIQLEVKIFDDCSSDKTLEILSSNVNKKDIFRSSKNLGYGGNVKKSFHYGFKHNFKYMAIFPGDMQRDFDDLLNMIRELVDNDYDVIVGKKYQYTKSKNMPVKRKLGNLIFTQIVKIWNDRTEDPLTGFKIYKIDPCKDIIWLCHDKFGFDLDFSFWSSLKKLKIYPFNASVTYENHISTIGSTTLQGLNLLIRFFLLGIIIQPVIKILRKSSISIEKNEKNF